MHCPMFPCKPLGYTCTNIPCVHGIYQMCIRKQAVKLLLRLSHNKGTPLAPSQLHCGNSFYSSLFYFYIYFSTFPFFTFYFFLFILICFLYFCFCMPSFRSKLYSWCSIHIPCTYKRQHQYKSDIISRY